MQVVSCYQRINHIVPRIHMYFREYIFEIRRNRISLGLIFARVSFQGYYFGDKVRSVFILS